MIFLCYCKTFLFSSVRMRVYSNFNKSVRNSYTASLKPIKVNQSKFNFDFLLLKRHYQRPIKGDRFRTQDSLPKGFELIYKENSTLNYTRTGVVHLFAWILMWKTIKIFVWENPVLEEVDEDLIFMGIPLTDKYDCLVGCLIGACLGALLCHYLLRTPLRMYRKNNEIIVVYFHFLKPYEKKFLYCSKNDIRPMAYNQLTSFLRYMYDIKGVKYYLPDYNFKSAADLNEFKNKERLRTKINDIADEILRWKEKFNKK